MKKNARAIVKNGIDVIERHAHLFEGKRLGLVTGPTGLDRKLKSTIDIFNEGFDLKALYSPEHGVRGNFQAGVSVGTYIDEGTGITAYSLYGDSRKPTPEMLGDIDVLVMDIQDIGSRYYTYLYTMSYCMEACAENKKTFVCLDRVNPIGGLEVEGGILDAGYASFVGRHPIPPRYGLTAGELALLFNSEYGIFCEMEVVKAEGWQRDMYFQDTGLIWVNPSPNITSVETALLYNGTCLFEGTNLSEGRGTTKPFELIGAPWLEPFKLAERMNGKALPGVLFRPVYFEPAFSKHKGRQCKGVQVHVTDFKAIRPLEVGLQLLYEIMDFAPDKFQWVPPVREKGRYFIDLLAGGEDVRLRTYEAGELLEKWRGESSVFKSLKEKYHLYETPPAS